MAARKAQRALLKERGVQLAWSLDEGSFLFDGMLPGVDVLMAAINVAEKGSVTLNVVANDAVEVRLPPGSGRPASRVSNWQSPGFEVVERAIREVYGDVVVTPGLMIAGSDSRHYGKVADNAFRFNPMTVTPADMSGFHGTNEKIGVQNLAQGVRTYVRIVSLGTME